MNQHFWWLNHHVFFNELALRHGLHNWRWPASRSQVETSWIDSNFRFVSIEIAFWPLWVNQCQSCQNMLNIVEQLTPCVNPPRWSKMDINQATIYQATAMGKPRKDGEETWTYIKYGVNIIVLPSWAIFLAICWEKNDNPWGNLTSLDQWLRLPNFKLKWNMDEAIPNGCVWNLEMAPRNAILIGIRNIYSDTWVTCGWNCFMNLLGARICLKENWQDIPINPNYKTRGEFNPGLSVAFPSINRLNMVSLSESLLAQLWSACTEQIRPQ